MFGIRFLKTRPTEYVLLYRRGRIRKQGAGISFFHYAPASTIVIVPADSRDAPFIFKETTVDFQEVDIQGQVTFRVTEPERLASMLDFAVDASGRYTGDGLEKLSVRLTNVVQVTLREPLRNLDLKGALTSASTMVEHVRSRLKEVDALRALGLEVIDFSILKIAPTPEIARALEASARENLLKTADEAVYERRNFAVEQERRIQENELQTKISIEEKNRRIREEQMNAEIAVQEKRGQIQDMKMDKEIQLEDRRRKLTEHESANVTARAKARATALEVELGALAKLEPQLLAVLADNQMDARRLVARSLGRLAEQAEKIGTLNISPELLHSLLAAESGLANLGNVAQEQR